MNLENLITKIIKEEVYFHFSKGHGHGGQKINKKNTKAELYFNVHNSSFLDDEQKEKIINHGGHKIHHHEKILILTDAEERYQHANKKKVINHFRRFMEEALK